MLKDKAKSLTTKTQSTQSFTKTKGVNLVLLGGLGGLVVSCSYLLQNQ
jgi:hypothetical protein